MKRLVLIGGIISMILPAMADKDLSGYNLINEDTQDPTCAGPGGFETGTVTMAPMFVKNCAAGQYYNAAPETPVSNHPVWDSDASECKNPVTNATVAGISNEADCNNAELDYYYIIACVNAENGYYSAASTPLVENGILRSTTPTQCPVGYRDGSDGDRASETDCYKYCGTGDAHTTMSAADLSGMHATNATYLTPTVHNDGSECIASIDPNGCAEGFEYVDLGGDDFSSTICELGHTGNCTSEIAPNGEIAPGTWFIKSDANHLEASGTIEYDSNTQECSATLSYLKFYDNVRTDAFTVNLGTADQAGSCLKTSATAQAFYAGVLKHYTDGIMTDGAFCLAKTVNIEWKEVDNPGAAATCTYGGALTLPDNPSKDGYEFVGWTVGEVETTPEP